MDQLENLEMAYFPGSALAAFGFRGELRGYDVVASGAGGNCVDLEYAHNPYRFYGLRASGCANGSGIYLKGTSQEEFHGVSAFGNQIDLSLTGHKTDPWAYVLIDGAQFEDSTQENMYLDQQNETLLCAANCLFRTAWQTTCTAGQSCAAIEIGHDARTSATGSTPVIAQFNQGIFGSATQYDVYFDAGPAGHYCNCSVALGGGMVDVATQSGTNPGQPTTNNPALLAGQTTYAQPVFANAASVGVPLTLNPNELGIGLSTDTEGGPGKGGLKLRVECSTTTSGDVKIVALAGTSTETLIKDGIGGGTVSKCP